MIKVCCSFLKYFHPRICILILDRKHECEIEASTSCLLYVPDWAWNPQARYVPWLGIELVTFWYIWWQSNQLSHSAGAFCSLFRFLSPPDFYLLWSQLAVTSLFVICIVDLFVPSLFMSLWTWADLFCSDWRIYSLPLLKTGLSQFSDIYFDLFAI